MIVPNTNYVHRFIHSFETNYFNRWQYISIRREILCPEKATKTINDHHRFCALLFASRSPLDLASFKQAFKFIYGKDLSPDSLPPQDSNPRLTLATAVELLLPKDSCGEEEQYARYLLATVILHNIYGQWILLPERFIADSNLSDSPKLFAIYLDGYIRGSTRNDQTTVEKLKKLYSQESVQLAEMGIQTILLFGSGARGEDYELSDIDLAVRFSRGLSKCDSESAFAFLRKLNGAYFYRKTDCFPIEFIQAEKLSDSVVVFDGSVIKSNEVKNDL